MSKIRLKNSKCKICEDDLIQVHNATVYCRSCQAPILKTRRRVYAQRARAKSPEYREYNRQQRKKNYWKNIEIGAYAVFNSSGEIIYVGRTDNFVWRMRSHHSTAAWIIDAVSVDFISCDTFGEALVQEAILIRDHQPMYNKDGVIR